MPSLSYTPPPMGAVLKAMVEFMIVIGFSVQIPPPSLTAVLPLIVTLVREPPSAP